MIITKVAVENYRSFGENDNVLKINRGVTTVVGMNGSGKSNLVEIIGKCDLVSGINDSAQLSSKRNRITQGVVKLHFTLSALSDEDKAIVGEGDTVISLGEGNLYSLKGGALAALSTSVDSYDIVDTFRKGKYEKASERESILKEAAWINRYSEINLKTYAERLANIKKRLHYLPEELKSEVSSHVDRVQQHVIKLIDSLPIIYFQRENRTLKNRYSISEVRPYSSDNKESVENKPDDLLLSLLSTAQIDRKRLEETMINQSSSARESFGKFLFFRSR